MVSWTALVRVPQTSNWPAFCRVKQRQLSTGAWKSKVNTSPKRPAALNTWGLQLSIHEGDLADSSESDYKILWAWDATWSDTGVGKRSPQLPSQFPQDLHYSCLTNKPQVCLSLWRKPLTFNNPIAFFLFWDTKLYPCDDRMPTIGCAVCGPLSGLWIFPWSLAIGFAWFALLH